MHQVDAFLKQGSKGNPQLMPTDQLTFKPSHPTCHTQLVTPNFTTTSTETHTWLQQLVHQFIQQSNGSTYTHSTKIFTTQHVSTPNQLLANPPEPNLGPRPDQWSKYHGKFTKSLATSQLQLCLSLLLDTYLPCLFVWYLFIIFTSCHSTFYFYLYISFSSMGSPSFPLWIPC